MKKKVIIILLALAGSYGIASAQKPAMVINDKTGWHKIGETTVNFEKDSDEILVMGADRFASLKFKTTNAPIDLMSMQVYYENGDKQDINIGNSIEAKGESRVIDLNGGERTLKKIVLSYKTVPNQKDRRAHVEVWGLKTNTDMR